MKKTTRKDTYRITFHPFTQRNNNWQLQEETSPLLSRCRLFGADMHNWPLLCYYSMVVKNPHRHDFEPTQNSSRDDTPYAIQRFVKKEEQKRKLSPDSSWQHNLNDVWYPLLMDSSIDSFTDLVSVSVSWEEDIISKNRFSGMFYEYIKEKGRENDWSDLPLLFPFLFHKNIEVWICSLKCFLLIQWEKREREIR